MKKFIVVGLGNIGAEYEETRHNVGFKVIEALAEKHGGKWEQGKNALICKIGIRGRKVLLIKPTTYMNLSGKPTRYYMQAEKLEMNNLLVVADELALPFGQLRLRGKGSDGGHNGHKHIIQLIGSTKYPRLRFGIGNEYLKGKQVNYVLGEWSREELDILKERIDTSVSAIEMFVFSGIGQAMTQFNGK